MFGAQPVAHAEPVGLGYREGLVGRREHLLHAAGGVVDDERSAVCAGHRRVDDHQFAVDDGDMRFMTQIREGGPQPERGRPERFRTHAATVRWLRVRLPIHRIGMHRRVERCPVAGTHVGHCANGDHSWFLNTHHDLRLSIHNDCIENLVLITG